MAIESPSSANRVGRLIQDLRSVSYLGRPCRWAIVILALQAPSWVWQIASGNFRAEERALFSLDLLAAAIVACFSSALGALALAIAWSAEGLRVLAKNYHFLSALDFLEATRFAALLGLTRFITVPVLIGAIALAASACVVLRQTRGRRELALPLVSTMLALALMDGLNGSSRILGLGGDQRLLAVNLAGSPSWNTLEDRRTELYSDKAPRPAEDPVAFRLMRDWHATHPRAGILLVLVESMGEPRAKPVSEWLAGRLYHPLLRQRWQFSAGTEPFAGNTTAGELRVLCGLHGHYSRLTDSLAADCLPSRLRRSGMATVALHGFSLRMFDRRDWWPRIGLTPWNGAPLAGQPPHTGCNAAFPGVCDDTLLSEAVAQVGVGAGTDRFVYALTLDTHLPLAMEGESPDADLTARCLATRTADTACQLVARVGAVLARLAAALAASPATPLVVVVGDHSPPFVERANREAFEQARVPLFVLAPAQEPGQ